MGSKKLFACPQCSHPNAPRRVIEKEMHTDRYYGCSQCRCFFSTFSEYFQTNERVVARSPSTVRPTIAEAKQKEGKVAFMGCPTCGKYGYIRMTENRNDVGEYWRRHQCATCGPYYTCETDDGVTVHRKKPSKKAASHAL